MRATTEFLKRPYARVVVRESDGTFRSEISEFPGCLATGETAAEALANLEDVAESWVTSMLARGQTIPSPFEENEFSGKLVLRLAKSIHQKAAKAARVDGVSLNTFISNCVAECLGGRKRSSAPYYIANFSQQNNTIHISERTFVSSVTSVAAPPMSAPALGSSVRNSTSNPWNTSNA